MTTTETFSAFDPADYLNSFEDVTAYLEAVIEEGDDDPAVLTQALGAIARSRNLSEIARQAGISREGLYKALSPGGNPTFATVVKVARAMGLRVHFQSVARSDRRSGSRVHHARMRGLRPAHGTG